MKWSQTSPSSLLDYKSTAAWLRLDNDDDAQIVSDLIDACTSYAEKRLGTSLMTRMITAVYYDSDALYLPHGPIGYIASVTDANGVPVTGWQLKGWGKADYLDLMGSAPFRPITVVYSAGYGGISDVPAEIRLAIRQHVSTCYTVRESISIGKSNIGDAVPHSLEAFYSANSRETGIG
jgi:hypothetical protein